MSVIKSYSVGNGDMYYIEHNSDNFTIIDCCLDDQRQKSVLDDLDGRKQEKNICRFISTHPDEDHIRGLHLLHKKIDILNFYCVKNNATKDDETESFTQYCALRDDTGKAFYIAKGCKRKWMNEKSEERGTSGISILWPDVNNAEFKAALAAAAEGESPNNISPIIRYSLEDGVVALWMGDLGSEFLEAVQDELDVPKVDVLFAPHHGRDSGKVPASLLEKMSPRLIIIGEAPSEHLHYYPGYHTITQNSAGDIIFACEEGAVHIFTSNVYDVEFLDDQHKSWPGYYYVGTLKVSKR